MEVVVDGKWDNLTLQISMAFPANAAFIGLSGPSGAGKSTLMRCLAGLNSKVSMAGRWDELSFGKVRTGLVFQDSVLFPHLSVGQNLLLAADYAKQQRYHFDEVVLGCKCNHLMSRMPATLSGGEAQRVAIARALLNSPDILLLDEPVSALDNALKHHILSYLLRLTNKGLKILMVSHDLRELALYSDYMAWLEQGRIKHQGRADDVIAALTPVLPGFENRFAVLKGEIEENLDEVGCHAIRCEGHRIYARHPMIENGLAMLTVDARDVSVDREGALSSSIVNSMSCTIEHISDSRDGQLMLTLLCGKVRLYALISTLSYMRMQLALGEQVTARFKMR